MIILIETVVIFLSAIISLAVPPALFKWFGWDLSKMLGYAFSSMYILFAHSYYFLRILVKRPVSEIGLKRMEIVNVVLTLYTLFITDIVGTWPEILELAMCYWPFLFIAWVFNKTTIKESFGEDKSIKTKLFAPIVFFVVIGTFLSYPKVVEIWDDFHTTILVASQTEKINNQPKNVKLLIERAFLYQNKKEFELALQDYNAALEINSDNPMIYFQRGWVYSSAIRNYELAISDMSKVIELAPNYDSSYDVRGLAYAILGENENALADFEKVLELTNDPITRQQAQQQILEISEYFNSK